MENKEWTTDVSHIASSFHNYQKNNIFHIHQKTSVDAVSPNLLQIFFETATSTAIVDAIPNHDTQQWTLKIWCSPIITINQEMIRLALYTMRETETPHARIVLDPPSPILMAARPQQLQLGDEDYESDWYKVFNQIEEITLEKYKEYFFSSTLEKYPLIKIEHLQISYGAHNNFIMRVFAIQDLTTFIFNIAEEKITLKLGTLLGAEKSHEYSVHYGIDKTDKEHKLTPIREELNAIQNGSFVTRESLNSILTYSIREAEQLRELADLTLNKRN